MCAFPLFVLVYGVLFARARRYQPLEEGAARRGGVVLGLCLAALALGLGTGFLVRNGGLGGYLLYGIVEVILLTAAVQSFLLLRQRLGRSLRVGSGVLLTSTVLLVLLLPFTVWIAAEAQQMGAYNNPNETEVRAALARNPSDAAAHSSLAHIDMMRGDYAGEMAEWQQVLRVEPDNQNALLLLAGRLARAGRTDEARPLYQKLADDNGPYHDSARKWLARHSG